MSPEDERERKQRLFTDALSKHQENIDKDKDGALTLDEVMSVGAQLGLTEAETEAFYKEMDKDGDGVLSAKEVHKASLMGFFIFNFAIAPFGLFVVCFILGALLAAIEGWTALQGFYFVACDVTGTGPFFDPADENLTLFGEFMEIIISIIALTISSGIVGLSCIMSLASDLPDLLGVVNSPARGAFTIFFVVPAFVLAFCALLGAVFAGMEGWPFRDGFEFLVQTVCGLNTPLTNREPESDHSRIIALAIAIAALGITSVVVGLVGAMAICEDAVYVIEVKLGEFEDMLFKPRTRPGSPKGSTKVAPAPTVAPLHNDGAPAQGGAEADTTSTTVVEELRS